MDSTRIVKNTGIARRVCAAAGAVPAGRAFMEVCGTHTVAAFRSGPARLLPANVKLLSGPGCPVCVTAQGDIDLLIDAARAGVTLCTYGDMLGARHARQRWSWRGRAGREVKVHLQYAGCREIGGGEPGRAGRLRGRGFRDDHAGDGRGDPGSGRSWG